MISADRITSALYRASANTRYAIGAVTLQYTGLHKAEQLIGDLKALCLFSTATDEQRTKAVEYAIAYSEELHSLLSNAGPNKEKIAHLVATTLVKFDDLCAEILSNPVPESVPTKIETAPEIPRNKGGRPRAVPAVAVAEESAPL